MIDTCISQQLLLMLIDNSHITYTKYAYINDKAFYTTYISIFLFLSKEKAIKSHKIIKENSNNRGCPL